MAMGQSSKHGLVGSRYVRQAKEGAAQENWRKGDARGSGRSTLRGVASEKHVKTIALELRHDPGPAISGGKSVRILCVPQCHPVRSGCGRSSKSHKKIVPASKAVL